MKGGSGSGEQKEEGSSQDETRELCEVRGVAARRKKKRSIVFQGSRPGVRKKRRRL